MSYKTELQELENELIKAKREKDRKKDSFFKAASKRAQDLFPFSSVRQDIFGDLKLAFSTNGKFKASKTTACNVWFLDDVTFYFYHEKGQAEKVEKAKQIIEKLYEGESDERD